jgi:hypothetical protein
VYLLCKYVSQAHPLALLGDAQQAVTAIAPARSVMIAPIY